MHPTLVAFVDGIERARLEPPGEVAGRGWLLAVAAVQVNVAAGRLHPVLRMHVTGAAAPQIVELDKRSQVDIALVEGRSPPGRLPELTMSGLDGAAARLAIAVDGDPGAEAVLSPEQVGDEPPPRAFGHVYSRWLRDGGHESGYDLTDFQSSPKGVKYRRIQSATARPPLVVSYLISIS